MSSMNAPSPKPWFKRSELWLTVGATIASALIPVAQAGPLTPGTAAPVLVPIILKLLGMSLPISTYNISRGISKAGTGN